MAQHVEEYRPAATVSRLVRWRWLLYAVLLLASIALLIFDRTQH